MGDLPTLKHLAKAAQEWLDDDEEQEGYYTVERQFVRWMPRGIVRMYKRIRELEDKNRRFRERLEVVEDQLKREAEALDAISLEFLEERVSVGEGEKARRRKLIRHVLEGRDRLDGDGGGPGEVSARSCPPGELCRCQCPDGPCGHRWDGPLRETGRSVEATCSNCGLGAIDHSRWAGR